MAGVGQLDVEGVNRRSKSQIVIDLALDPKCNVILLQEIEVEEEAIFMKGFAYQLVLAACGSLECLAHASMCQDRPTARSVWAPTVLIIAFINVFGTHSNSKKHELFTELH